MTPIEAHALLWLANGALISIALDYVVKWMKKKDEKE